MKIWINRLLVWFLIYAIPVHAGVAATRVIVGKCPLQAPVMKRIDSALHAAIVTHDLQHEKVQLSSAVVTGPDHSPALKVGSAASRCYTHMGCAPLHLLIAPAPSISAPVLMSPLAGLSDYFPPRLERPPKPVVA